MEDDDTHQDDAEGASMGWLGTKDAADRLGITPRTLYRLIDDGGIPAYKIGRVIRIKTADIDAFLEQSRIEPGTLKNLYPPRKGSE